MRNKVVQVKLVDMVANAIMKQIKKGLYSVGTNLPIELELAEMYGVSRNTVREAVKILVAEGMIEVNQGSGTKVISKVALSEYKAKYEEVQKEIEELKKFKEGFKILANELEIDLSSVAPYSMYSKNLAVLAFKEKYELLNECLEQCNK